jgi:glycopeptide antibiotics resistance protein
MSWKYLSDVLLNIAGFVPVGFLLCAYLALTRPRANAILYSVLAGGVLSFAIEVMQAYIPRRISGVTDIITNTLGAALGAWLARPHLVRAILRTTKFER